MARKPSEIFAEFLEAFLLPGKEAKEKLSKKLDIIYMMRTEAQKLLSSKKSENRQRGHAFYRLIDALERELFL
jgi:hypothetical protein